MNLFILFWLLQNPKRPGTARNPLPASSHNHLQPIAVGFVLSGDSRKEEGDEIAAAQAPGLRPPPQQQGGEGPPPAKLDELAYTAQVPEFFSVLDVARCRARMRAKIGGVTRQLRFRRFFPSFCIYTFFCNFWALLGTVNHSYRSDLAGSIERIIFGSVIQVDGPVQRTNLFLSVIIR
jgi:hypothetical protein